MLLLLSLVASVFSSCSAVTVTPSSGITGGQVITISGASFPFDNTCQVSVGYNGWVNNAVAACPEYAAYTSSVATNSASDTSCTIVTITASTISCTAPPGLGGYPASVNISCSGQADSAQIMYEGTNVALNKSGGASRLSSNYGDLALSFCLDGTVNYTTGTDTVRPNNFCHTDSTGLFEFMLIDLGSPFNILGALLFNRDGCVPASGYSLGYRESDFSIFFFADSSYTSYIYDTINGGQNANLSALIDSPVPQSTIANGNQPVYVVPQRVSGIQYVLIVKNGPASINDGLFHFAEIMVVANVTKATPKPTTMKPSPKPTTMKPSPKQTTMKPSPQPTTPKPSTVPPTTQPPVVCQVGDKKCKGICYDPTVKKCCIDRTIKSVKATC